MWPLSLFSRSSKLQRLEKKKNSIDIDDKLTLNEKPTSSNCWTNHLAFFEQFIDKDMLEDFRNAEKGDILPGEIRNEGLFDVWLKIKGLSGIKIFQNIFISIKLALNEEIFQN